MRRERECGEGRREARRAGGSCLSRSGQTRQLHAAAPALQPRGCTISLAWFGYFCVHFTTQMQTGNCSLARQWLAHH